MNNSLRHTIRILLKLLKFRLSLMVSISAVMGYLFTGNRSIIEIFLVTAGVLLLAAGSSGINQYQEVELDKLMKRTARRPIPSGEISKANALNISTTTAFIGFITLLSLGITPALLGLLNLIVYNFIYTPLKTKSPISIIPGAVVGAIPPIIGWTATGASALHPNIIFIAIFMFSWQLPHFWLLLIIYGKDYEDAGFSSITKYFNTRQIKYLVFSWAVITSLFIFLFPLFNINLSSFLITILVIVNIMFIILFYNLILGNTDKSRIRKAFVVINSFMMLVLLIFIINLLI